MRIIGSLVTLIVALGVAYGIAQWAGDGQPLFSEDWFTAVTEKIDVIINKGHEAGQNLPDPESVNLPTFPESVSPVPPTPDKELN